MKIIFQTTFMRGENLPGFQATNEIVKELTQKGLNEAENVGQEISLTSKGLDKCGENCK